MNGENMTENTGIPETAARGQPPGLLLSGAALKIIGVILMVPDHLHQMFINQGAPFWFNWLGRPVAAIFLFLCSEGFYYTRNKRLYILRFLAAFILMNLVNGFLTRFLYVENVALINNIFGTLCMSAFYMLMIDLFRKGIREKKPGRILLALCGVLGSLAAGLVLAALFFGKNPPGRVVVTLFFFIPTPLSVEGGFFLTGVGVLFYALRKYRWAQILLPAAAGLVSFLISREDWTSNVQWMMFFAALPIFLYNGKRGRGNKYFFYVFYPAHIYLFYIIAWFLRPG
ncbi:MAG: conjugal transfer protein TraX [Treponema sp.]|jgi:hypothetical protein|nr:conjugal transfer protein TraX [Treponema sp.]